MAKSVYWCSHCGVPVIENSKCPICGNGCKSISSTGICNPVFRQEKKLLSLILGADLLDNNVWYLGSSTYLIDGNRVRLPYVDFFKQKKHLLIADSLRDEIENNDEIPNLQLYLEANERYLNDALVYEAEEYISNLIRELSEDENKKYIPTVSFSGGKDSTVVSRLVRDALQDESIIHYFGDTTLEFPATHVYVDDYFHREPLYPDDSQRDRKRFL